LSFKANEDVSEAKLKVVTSEMLNEIANASLNSGSGLIGHVKAYVKTSLGSFKASLLDVKHGVDFSGNFKGSTREGEMTIYAVVKDLEDKILKNILEGKVEKILSQYRFDFRLDEHDSHF
jgi:hypothetical protein